MLVLHPPPPPQPPFLAKFSLCATCNPPKLFVCLFLGGGGGGGGVGGVAVVYGL